MEAIIPADDASTLLVWGQQTDMAGLSPKIIRLPILAWAVGGERPIPITAAGRVDPHGAWVVIDRLGNLTTSAGEMLRIDQNAEIWLRNRAVP